MLQPPVPSRNQQAEVLTFQDQIMGSKTGPLTTPGASNIHLTIAAGGGMGRQIMYPAILTLFELRSSNYPCMDCWLSKASMHYKVVDIWVHLRPFTLLPPIPGSRHIIQQLCLSHTRICNLQEYEAWHRGHQSRIKHLQCHRDSLIGLQLRSPDPTCKVSVLPSSRPHIKLSSSSLQSLM